MNPGLALFSSGNPEIETISSGFPRKRTIPRYEILGNVFTENPRHLIFLSISGIKRLKGIFSGNPRMTENMPVPASIG